MTKCPHCKSMWEPERSWCPYCGFGFFLGIEKGEL